MIRYCTTTINMLCLELNLDSIQNKKSVLRTDFFMQLNFLIIFTTDGTKIFIGECLRKHRVHKVIKENLRHFALKKSLEIKKAPDFSEAL